MCSKRVTLHGINPNEKSSPLKKKLREYTLTNSSILRDNDYVDVELETVITTRKQRKLRKTISVKGNSTDTSHTLMSSGFVAGNDDLTLNCKEGIEERYKGSSEINSDASFQESFQGDFSHVSEDDQEETISYAYAAARSNECLEVEASNASLGNWDVEWWNIVPPESFDSDAGYDDGVCVDEDSGAFLLSGHGDTHVGDFIDGADLLKELRTLNDAQKVFAQEEHSENSDDLKLFPNSQLSLKESVVLLLGIVTRHQLTGVALEDILSFLRLVCPKENKVLKDAKEVFSFFQNHSQKIVKHFYCPNKKCQTYVSHTTLYGQESCGFCKGNLSEEVIFLEIPIQEQLKTILSRPDFVEKLSYRFSRVKHDETAIEDVYDGRLYQKLSAENGFLSNPDNLSLLGNTDGVALVRSSRAGVWPIYYVINELPPRERFSRANRLFAGLWFGKGKPHFATFMKPFCQSVRDLYTEGIEIDIFEAASSKKIRGILLDTTMDAPARSAWLNIRQFNGYSGCQVCTEPGEQLDLGPGKKNARRQCHVYPFNAEYAQTTGHAKIREHAVVKQQALVAMSQISQKGKVANPQEGVLGLSWAFSLPLHDVIAGTAVDYMHCICEGAVNQHLMAWFEDKSNDCYLGSSVNEIDSTLLSFKPISEITRRPRSISDWKQWKANEKRAFLLYYSIPLLSERLNETCLLHLAFLVGGVYRLLKESISKIDLEEAGVFLKLYCAQAPFFYGKRFQTFNLHQVLHLKNNVENLGPLWSNSCFPFEDYNGDLKGYFHGSQNIQGQIVNSICVHQSLPQLAETMPESDAKQLSRELLSKSYHCRTVGEEISHNTFVVGSLERVWGTSSLLSENEREVVGAVSKMWVFKRAIVSGVEYQSVLYKRTTSRNNCTVIFQRHGKNHYGSIEKFVKCVEKCTRMQCLHEKCSCPLSVRYIAVVKKLSRHPCQFPIYHGMQVVKHILRVTITDRVLAVPISSIKEKCMRIDVDLTRVYVCHIPNSIEKD